MKESVKHGTLTVLGLLFCPKWGSSHWAGAATLNVSHRQLSTDRVEWHCSIKWCIIAPVAKYVNVIGRRLCVCAFSFYSTHSFRVFFSGMFFDGNHTYMIEPAGQGSSDVSRKYFFVWWGGSLRVIPLPLPAFPSSCFLSLSNPSVVKLYWCPAWFQSDYFFSRTIDLLMTWPAIVRFLPFHINL